MQLIDKILKETKNYYDEKIIAHDATPAGVDWNGLNSQELRFKQLLNCCDTNQEFSINDIGCGYAALYEYLTNMKLRFNYRGLDVSELMIEKAKQIHSMQKNCVFTTNFNEIDCADYSVASGIFNVKQNFDNAGWLDYILWTLEKMHAMSHKGFAFNLLTSYSDSEYMRDDLYYADPCYFFDYCKKHYAKNIALLHDYGLYEFTIIVRKTA